MKLANVMIFRIEYEVQPSFENWTAIIAASSPEEACAYITRFWGKKCNFTSVGQQMRLDAISGNVIAQVMKKLGIPATGGVKKK